MADNNLISSIKRAYVALYDKDYVLAASLANDILRLYPESAHGYAILLGVDMQMTLEEMEHNPINLEDNQNYQRIMMFGDDDLKLKYQNVQQAYQAMQETVRTTMDYYDKNKEAEPPVNNADNEEILKKLTDEKIDNPTLDMDVIFKRGSIRKFKPFMVEPEKIHKILEAGFAAPSALNLRPYHFMVIDDREVLDQLATVSRGKKVLLNAPMAIAVFADNTINPKMEFLLNDTSACIQNMLLAITALGLGGCWLGQLRADDDRVHAILRLPNHELFVSGFIALGYPDEEKVQPNRFDESKLHHNKW